MLDTMTETAMFAMHEDRLARARRRLLLIEADRARTGKRAGRPCASRERIAQRLVALAERIAPTVTMTQTGTGVPAR
jgi:hypothetical protein